MKTARWVTQLEQLTGCSPAEMAYDLATHAESTKCRVLKSNR
jgi:hypothetical protein